MRSVRCHGRTSPHPQAHLAPAACKRAKTRGRAYTTILASTEKEGIRLQLESKRRAGSITENDLQILKRKYELKKSLQNPSTEIIVSARRESSSHARGCPC